MTITALPPPPTPVDTPTDFNSKAFNLLGALPQFVTDANALQADVVAKQAAAADSEAVAKTKAGEASASAATATTKAGEASTSADSALSSLNSFKGQYYGPLASDPTLDPLGAACSSGDLYLNTTVPELRIYKGGAWGAAYLSLTSPAFTGSPTAPTAPAGDMSGQLANTEFVQSAIAPGTISFSARTTAAAGWLKANGAAISRTSYAALFAAIGTTYGVGDGTTTFNLPDLRGEFLRALDDGRGVDVGRAVGSFQGQQFEDHTHQVKGSVSGASGSAITVLNNVGVDVGSGGVATSGTRGTETRPRNVALLACIKY